LKALDEDSKILRFGFNIKEETLANLCKGFEQDPKQHVLFCVENDDLEFIAVGHIALGEEMELAFSVLKEYQGQGIGNKLMKRCIRHCRTRNILKGTMVCLGRNKAIQKLCTKNRIQFHTEYGDSEANIQLDEPHVSTYINEGIAINSAVIDYMGKRAKLPWTLVSKTFDNILK